MTGGMFPDKLSPERMLARTGPTFYDELTTPPSSSPEAVESILHAEEEVLLEQAAKDAMPHITKLVIKPPLNNPVSFPDNPLHCPSTG